MAEETVTAQPQDDPQTPESEERESVRRWRFTQFRLMGFSIHEAAWLSRGAADLHQVERMVDAGCATETVLRIVL